MERTSSAITRRSTAVVIDGRKERSCDDVRPFAMGALALFSAVAAQAAAAPKGERHGYRKHLGYGRRKAARPRARQARRRIDYSAPRDQRLTETKNHMMTPRATPANCCVVPFKRVVQNL